MKKRDDMEKRYMFDPYTVQFEAGVRKVDELENGSSAVYLDRTYFYPESGGQPADRGEIAGLEVFDVQEDGEGVRHLVRGLLEEGAAVRCSIDWERRFDHMQQHSGQHLLSRIFEDIFGFSTLSFHLGRKVSTIDLDTSEVSRGMLEEVETRANMLVWKSIPIRSEVLGKDEFLRRVRDGGKYSKLRTKLPDLEEDVRVVEIEGLDISTCCGTHCSSTAELGPVRLVGSERVRGNVRVEFLCGGRALTDCREKGKVLDELAGIFSNEWRKLPGLVAGLVEENKELRKRNETLSMEAARKEAQSLADEGGRIGEYELVKRVFDELELSDMRNSAFALREKTGRVVLLAARGPKVSVVFACSRGLPFDMGSVMKRCMGDFGGKGGGGRDFAQGGGIDAGRLEEVLDKAEEILKGHLEGP